MNSLLRLLAAMVILSSLGACASARRSEPLANSPLSLTPALARGEKVFQAHCHQCHVQGEAALGPALNNKPLPAFLLRTQVRHGLGAMPSFPESRISEEELDDLVAYVKALRKNR